MKNSRVIQYRFLKNKVVLPRNILLNSEILLNSINSCNRVFEDLNIEVPYLYELLGMRNLSSFVGAVFARELQSHSSGLLLLNPHQDGYPDLLLLDDEGQLALNEIGINNRSKDPFSPFKTGGVEIKATCGDVPSAKQLIKKGLDKPLIGDQRIDLIKNYNWKAHHRSTNYLLGILWDFIDQIPTITAVMYSNNLVEIDWGKIVQPVEGGGRTTSVSILSKSGVQKMFNNIIYIIEDQKYLKLIK